MDYCEVARNCEHLNFPAPLYEKNRPEKSSNLSKKLRLTTLTSQSVERNCSVLAGKQKFGFSQPLA